MPKPDAALQTSRFSTLTRREHLLLLLIPLLALAVRTWFWAGQQANNPFFVAPAMDEQRHDEWAWQIATGQGMGDKPYFRAPLYYYWLGAWYTLAGHNIALGRFVGVVLGALTCYLITRLGVALADFRVGFIAGLIAALYWPLIYFDEQLLTVGLEVFLNVAMLLLLLTAARRASLWLYLIAGIVWGLSAVARPNILAFAPGILLWIWIGARLSERKLHKPAAIGLALAGAAIAILPWTIRNRVVGGEWALIATNGGVNFYIGNNPDADGIAAVVPGTSPGWEGGYQDTHRIAEEEMGRPLSEGEVSQYWFRKGLSWIASAPGQWLALTFHKFRLFWSPIEIPNNQPIWPFAKRATASWLFIIGFPIIACLGIVGLVFVRDWRRWLLPVTYAVIYMGTVVLFFCPGRYRLPIAPVLILLTAVALVRGIEYLRERHAKRVLGGVGTLVMMSLFLFTNPPDRQVIAASNEANAERALAMYYVRLSRDDPSVRPDIIAHLERAVAAVPDDPRFRMTLAEWFGRLGRSAEAVPHFERVVAAMPNDVAARWGLAEVLRASNQLNRARAEYERVLALDPAHEIARERLTLLSEPLPRPAPSTTPAERARTLVTQGRWAEAAEILREAVEVQPQNIALLINLTEVLSLSPADDVRDGAAALKYADRAMKLSNPPSVRLVNALAAAYAADGQFENAIAISEQALQICKQGGHQAQVADITARLELYRAGKALHER